MVEDVIRGAGHASAVIIANVTIRHAWHAFASLSVTVEPRWTAAVAFVGQLEEARLTGGAVGFGRAGARFAVGVARPTSAREKKKAMIGKREDDENDAWKSRDLRSVLAHLLTYTNQIRRY